MKKLLVTLMASMLLLSSTTYAVELSKTSNPAVQMTTMSKAEVIRMLKDAGVEPSKIKMLKNGEMAQTEGEWFWVIGVLLGLAAGYAANKALKSKPMQMPPAPADYKQYYYEDGIKYQIPPFGMIPFSMRIQTY